MLNIWNTDLVEDEKLWRYFTTERFSYLMENSSMYFAALTQFTDSFEGSTAVQAYGFPVDARFAEREGLEEIFFRFRKLIKVNCWHRAEYESQAMWNLYADESKGVAICSSPSRIKIAFRPFRLQPTFGIEELYAGEVKYVDLLTVRLREAGLKRFFYKHMAFSWEREFRFAISLEAASEFVPNIPELGIEVSVDLDSLIDRIIIGPSLTSVEREHIISICQHLGLHNRLVYSSLLGRPRFI